MEVAQSVTVGYPQRERINDGGTGGEKKGGQCERRRGKRKEESGYVMEPIGLSALRRTE